MIKYNLKELITKKEYSEKRKITITEIAQEVGVSRHTLYRMSNPSTSFSTKTEFIEKLCEYFDCTCDDLMTFIPAPPTKTQP